MYSESENARFVIRSWFKSTIQIEKLIPYAVNWLSKFKENENAASVISIWFNSNIELDKLLTYADN